MKIRTMNVNGRVYLDEQDVLALIRPLGVAIIEAKREGVVATNFNTVKVTKMKRRTKEELQESVRKLEGEPLEAIAKKLRIGIETVKKLALVSKE